MATIGKWIHTHDEEGFGCSEEFAERGEAIAAAVECGCGIVHEEGFVTGQVMKSSLGVTVGDAEMLLERLCDDLGQEVGEAAEEWADRLPFGDGIGAWKREGDKRRLEDLAENLDAAFRIWLHKYDLEPRCFPVAKIREHFAPAAKDVPNCRCEECEQARECIDHEGEHLAVV